MDAIDFSLCRKLFQTPVDIRSSDHGIQTKEWALLQFTNPLCCNQSIFEHVKNLQTWVNTFASVDDFECFAMLYLYGQYAVENNILYLFADLVGFQKLHQFSCLLDKRRFSYFTKTKLYGALGIPMTVSQFDLFESVLAKCNPCIDSVGSVSWWSTVSDIVTTPTIQKLQQLPTKVANSLLLILCGISYDPVSSDEIKDALAIMVPTKQETTWVLEPRKRK